MVNIVQELERLFLSRFQHLAHELEYKFPHLTFKVYHGQVGSETAYQGYQVSIECLFPDALSTESDSVALSVGACHLTTQPRIMADVVWGHPSGYSEAVFRDGWLSCDDWPEATSNCLQHIADEIPRLIQAFETAVQRGHPAR